jgi:hypothetical protein
VICSAKQGWSMSRDKTPPAGPTPPADGRVRGAHGYDNAYQEMQATFIAHGRAFKKKRTVEPFANVEVYNLMCKILGIKPAPNDGDLKRVQGLLR